MRSGGCVWLERASRWRLLPRRRDAAEPQRRYERPLINADGACFDTVLLRKAKVEGEARFAV